MLPCAARDAAPQIFVAGALIARLWERAEPAAGARSQNNVLAERAAADSSLTARAGKPLRRLPISHGGDPPCRASVSTTVGRRQLSTISAHTSVASPRKGCRRTIPVALTDGGAYQGRDDSCSLSPKYGNLRQKKAAAALASLAFPLRASPQSRGDNAKARTGPGAGANSTSWYGSFRNGACEAVWRTADD